MKFEWELLTYSELSHATLRAKVKGGWLVKDVTTNQRAIPDSYREDNIAIPIMVFVPDPNHEWSID